MQATWIARRVERWLSEIPAGRIHSRFDSVLNLAWGDHLITLALPEAGRLPGGILLDPATVQRGAWPGIQGDPVSWDSTAQVLRLPGGLATLGGAIRETREPAPLAAIDASRVIQNVQTLVRLAQLGAKGELVPLLGAFGLRGSGAGGARALTQVSGTWADQGAPEGSGTLGAPDPAAIAAWQELQLLTRALAAGDGPALVAVARPMLGRGEGLTPGWDDLLLGLIATIWFAGPALPDRIRCASQTLADALAEAAPTRTTAISANYLQLAADGGWSERLADATLALLGASGPALVAPIQRLLAFGHSSGHDTAVGLALGSVTILHLLSEGSPHEEP
ncbi:MAG TPA: DUF2877 domain-containing protein [Symbiobacteriaceae bacterium]|nr:DUF2877 domain-containing protein [Symbiobacteriaceae bacterium]